MKRNEIASNTYKRNETDELLARIYDAAFAAGYSKRDAEIVRCADGKPKQPDELDKFAQAIQHLRELWSEHCLNLRREKDEH